MVDTARIRDLISLARSNGLAAFEFEEAGFAVAFRFSSAHPRAGYDHAVEGERGAPGDIGPQDSERWVESPMVGVFRAREGPVAEGSSVVAGEMVGQIESMGILSDLISDVSGVVVSLRIADGERVEYGQPLILIHKGGCQD
jgi:biotin carboxyl carrier protein